MTDFNDYLANCMKDTEFKKEYNLSVEYQEKQLMIDNKKEIEKSLHRHKDN
ncbi:hypothetical protein PV797_09325 [Clostridiaceae bacterium M8S5]|nr:hypothetical protein PV797_09325 [Clostridiaceae bacterium M8S5]